MSNIIQYSNEFPIIFNTVLEQLEPSMLNHNKNLNNEVICNLISHILNLIFNHKYTNLY